MRTAMGRRAMAGAVVSGVVGFVCLAGVSTPGIDTKSDPVLKNGDFEATDATVAGRPLAWALPDGLGVQWTNDPAAPAHGLCIRMDTSVSERRMVEQWTRTGLTNEWNIPNAGAGPVSDTYGLSYYSDAMPATSGQAYRITFDFKGPGGGKVWVRCWGQYKGERRRLFEKVVECGGGGREWRTLHGVLNPTKSRAEVEEMKVMLYAYYPAGVYWFDNVKVEAISAEEYKTEVARKKEQAGR